MDHLQKQLKDGEGASGDTASVSGHSTHSTTSSSGRRRRRRNKNAAALAGRMSGPGGAHSLLGLDGGSSGIGPMIPKPAGNNVGSGDGKTPKLKIDLNLDVNLELKAQLKGDLCLSLV